MKPKPSRPPGAGRAPSGAIASERSGSGIETFPIVGIGASAGGLEALEAFLRHLPPKCGMAVVVVQHLDPTKKGMMPELLQRATSMKVVQVQDRTVVRPNRVYVIPPNKDMSLLHGVLHLLDPVEARGLRLPVDFFFRSMAHDRQERSIGVILSGMGSDGTLGLRAIKERAGIVLVQDPATAKFDSMPRSAVGAGLADIVAPVEELPARLVAYLDRTPTIAPAASPSGDGVESALDKTVILLREQTGHDFSLYKRNSLLRRIERRMGIHRIDTIAAYVRYLRENSQELGLLFKELLIGVTNFFRDPEVWDQLRKVTLPALLATRAPGRALRAWVPGCSTGEEVYSLAMVFREAVEQAKPRRNEALQIFATDLDEDAIARARLARYPANIAADVSAERLSCFFVQEENGYRVRREIREMVIFAPQNLIMDPPFTKLDILSCRNLLIYLNQEVQKKLMPLFHYSLNPGGILVLGSAETVGGRSDLFVTLSGKSRIFRRVDSVVRPASVVFPASFSAEPLPESGARTTARRPTSLQSLADRLVLEHYALPTLLVNDKGDILYVSGRTGDYLEPAAGKANWNIFAMARESLRSELSGAFHKAIRQKGCVTLHGLKIGTPGAESCVDIKVQRLDAPGPLEGLVTIVFANVPAAASARPTGPSSRDGRHSVRTSEMAKELLRVRAESRATHEEMQTSQEELRSANEELQSANEELQSANEELTTSREEMQSLNEELQTVNAELQAKVDDLSRASSDMSNLLNSTDIATLFLDCELNVRRFTPQVATIVKLIPGDKGRPITDLVSDLDYPALADDVRTVLRKLVSIEKPVAARDGRWFTVRIMPYRTMDDAVDGVVITFANITAAKTLEAKLLARQANLEERLGQLPPGECSPGKARNSRS